MGTGSERGRHLGPEARRYPDPVHAAPPLDAAAPPPLPRAFLAASLVLAVALVALTVHFQASALLAGAEAAAAKGRDPARLLAKAHDVQRAAPLAVLALAPLLTAIAGAFHPGLVAALRYASSGGLALIGAALAAWPVLVLGLPAQLTARGFDPYALAIVAAGGAAATLAGAGLWRYGLGGSALLLWLALWIPFDLRWYRRGLFPEASGFDPATQWGYEATALVVTALGLLAFGVAGRVDVGARPPERRDLLPAALLALLFGAVALPLGLWTEFLRWTPPRHGLLGFLGASAAIALTIALPEELFFRGILDRGLKEQSGRPLASLALSSLAFGLMHWNNRDALEGRLEYLVLATLAGVIYGLAYRATGALWAPVLVHALVDVVWATFLGGG